MDYASLTTDDFLAAAQAHLPRGLAWPRASNATQTSYFRAIAEILWTAHQDIVQLFGIELNPATTQALLPDFQAAFGIVPRGTEDQQRTQLVTVITDPGGASVAHYTALAAQLGISPFNAVSTGSFTWTAHAPAALSLDDRLALEDLINAQNRITAQVTFVYDL